MEGESAVRSPWPAALDDVDLTAKKVIINKEPTAPKPEHSYLCTPPRARKAYGTPPTIRKLVATTAKQSSNDSGGAAHFHSSQSLSQLPVKFSLPSFAMQSQTSQNHSQSTASMFLVQQPTHGKIPPKQSLSSSSLSSGLSRSSTGATPASMLTGGRRSRGSEVGLTLTNKLLGLSEKNYHKRDDSLDVDDQRALSRKGSGISDGVSDYNDDSLRSKSKLGHLFSAVHPANSKEREKMEILIELLELWERDGLPDFPKLANINFPSFEPERYKMEEHWTTFIDATDLAKRKADQQEAMWELFETEVKYIKSLYVIHDLFMSCLLNIQNDGVLNDICLEDMFSTITEVALSNINFWNEELLPILEQSRNLKSLLKPELLKAAFARLRDRFKPYTKYCMEQASCSDYVKSHLKSNSLFNAFVQWAQTQPQCNRLQLVDLLVKPMQRITKYHLLLKAVAKKTEEVEIKESLLDLVSDVSEFVKTINESLSRRHEKETLSALAVRLEPYEGAELPLMDSESSKLMTDNYMKLDIEAAMPACGNMLRNIIREGSLRLRDAHGKADVHCILFTDLLLFTKSSRRDRLRIVKPPIKIDSLVIHEMVENPCILLIHLTDFNVAQSAYTLHGEDISKWTKAFRKAQTLYRKAKEVARTQLFATPTPDSDDFGFAGPFGEPLAGGVPFDLVDGPQSLGGSLDEPDRTVPLRNGNGESAMQAASSSSSLVSDDGFAIITMDNPSDEQNCISSPEMGRKPDTLPSLYRQNRADSGEALELPPPIPARRRVHGADKGPFAVKSTQGRPSAVKSSQGSFSHTLCADPQPVLSADCHTRERPCRVTHFPEVNSDEALDSSLDSDVGCRSLDSSTPNLEPIGSRSNSPGATSENPPAPRVLSQHEIRQLKLQHMHILLDQSEGVEI